MPKLKMTVRQYLWCWLVVVLFRQTPVGHEFFEGYFIYLYIGSLSLIAIFLLIKYGGKTYLALSVSFFEFLSILLQLASCQANLSKEANWFHSNYREILHNLFQLEVILLTIAGIYGFGLLVWNFCRRIFDSGSSDRYQSVIFPLLYERRKQPR